MKLYIDTTKVRLAKVTMGQYEKTSSEILPLIEEALRVNKLTLSNITEIIIETGPGSFTGLRVGAAVANVLGVLLGVPVNGKKGLAIPKYASET